MSRSTSPSPTEPASRATPGEASIFAELRELFATRVAIHDGGYGTEIQRFRPKLTEEDFRGERYREHTHDLQGNNDILSITRPDVIKKIHMEYLEAGADFVETNTFSATSIAQADYELDRDKKDVYDINYYSAKIAKEACEEMYARDSKKRYVCGAMGPTNRTLSISPDVNDPAFRNITFMELVAAYVDQVHGLVEGGVDILLVETSTSRPS
jgi:5-methyltetrahydrofolate--homocysteine methyltransferase